MVEEVVLGLVEQLITEEQAALVVEWVEMVGQVQVSEQEILLQLVPHKVMMVDNHLLQVILVVAVEVVLWLLVVMQMVDLQLV